MLRCLAFVYESVAITMENNKIDRCHVIFQLLQSSTHKVVACSSENLFFSIQLEFAKRTHTHTRADNIRNADFRFLHQL